MFSIFARIILIVFFASPVIADANLQSEQTTQPESAQIEEKPTLEKPAPETEQAKSIDQVHNFYYDALDRIDERIGHWLDILGICISVVAVGITVIVAIFGIWMPLRKERKREKDFKDVLSQFETLKQDTNENIKKTKADLKKALAVDSGIHFMEHAKNLPNFGSDAIGSNVIERLSLVLYAVESFAKGEETSGISDCLEAISVLQLPRYSMGRDYNEDHNRMLSQYNMAYTAIKENGFEEKFKIQLKSIEKKIGDWYSNLPENKKPKPEDPPKDEQEQ